MLNLKEGDEVICIGVNSFNSKFRYYEINHIYTVIKNESYISGSTFFGYSKLGIFNKENYNPNYTWLLPCSEAHLFFKKIERTMNFKKEEDYYKWLSDRNKT